jgi:hypothetical protein
LLWLASEFPEFGWIGEELIFFASWFSFSPGRARRGPKKSIDQLNSKEEAFYETIEI